MQYDIVKLQLPLANTGKYWQILTKGRYSVHTCVTCQVLGRWQSNYVWVYNLTIGSVVIQVIEFRAVAHFIKTKGPYIKVNNVLKVFYPFGLTPPPSPRAHQSVQINTCKIMQLTLLFVKLSAKKENRNDLHVKGQVLLVCDYRPIKQYQQVWKVFLNYTVP